MVALPVPVDAVSFFAQSAGTGDYVYATPRSSFYTPAQAFAAGLLVNNQLVPYVAQDDPYAPTQREWGIGTYANATTTIARTTIQGGISAGVVSGAGVRVSFNKAPVVFIAPITTNVITGSVVPGTTQIAKFGTTPTSADNSGVTSAMLATEQVRIEGTNTNFGANNDGIYGGDDAMFFIRGAYKPSSPDTVHLATRNVLLCFADNPPGFTMGSAMYAIQGVANVLGTHTGDVAAVFGVAELGDGGAGATSAVNLYAFLATTDNFNGGVTGVTGETALFAGTAVNTSGNPIANQYGLDVGGSGNVTNRAQINLRDWTGTVSGNNYGIRQIGTTGGRLNLFDAPLQIGNALRTDATNNVVVGTAALATNAVAGFPFIPTCAGTPTGTVSPTFTGRDPLVYDSTNDILYINDGGWVPALFGTQWSQTTPTPTASSGTFTSVSSVLRIKQVGKLVHGWCQVVVTTLGTAAGTIFVALPFTPKSTTPVVGLDLSLGAAISVAFVDTTGSKLQITPSGGIATHTYIVGFTCEVA
jgi:hypothetical protein